MNTGQASSRVMILFPALLVLGATLFAFQAPTQPPGPSFTADYYEVSHGHGNAPDEASRGRQVAQGRFWRDREGRLRQEVWRIDAEGNRSNHRVWITDPALNLTYELQSDEKVAYRSKLLQGHANSPADPSPDSPPSIQPHPVKPAKTELGVQTIEGFSCHGYKSCYLRRCEDTWWCPALQYVARIRRTYDSGAVDEMVWSNFKVGIDPDPQLFVVPSDYTVIDRKKLELELLPLK
jgi:hypothetical protein